MTTQGFGHLYLETHNWGKSVAFWGALGFDVDFETDHHSGQLVAPNAPESSFAEQSPQDPVSSDVYLSVGNAPTDTPDGIDVDFDWTETHWGTQVMTVRDPDGRLFRLEAPTTKGQEQ